MSRVNKIAIVLALLLAFPATAAELSGIVSEVSDGDSLTLVNWQHTFKIRLSDIDAPELAQEYGTDSRVSLSHMCLLKKTVAATRGNDRYGRVLATVTCAGVDANAEQVRRGWAWVYIKYAPKNSPLYGLEREARLERRGLWADDEPVPPWEWRRVKREK